MARNIYIAKDHDGETLGIVIAEDEKIANAYFVGRGQIPHSTGVIDPTDPRLGVLGLVTLFKTKELHWGDLRDLANRRMGSHDKPLRVEDVS
jgi:hypothetical protein